MKSLIPALLLGCSGAAHAESIEVYGTHISISEQCEIETATTAGKEKRASLDFSVPGRCSLIKLGNTNVPHLEFIGGSYIILVESAVGEGSACKAEYKAIAVLRDGAVRVGTHTKESATCGSDRDRGAFTYLANKMGLM
jgi:hypothetical protein